MDFEWDEAKAEANFAKHGVRFATAASVFLDPKRQMLADDRFAYGEDRFISIGEVSGILMIVVHTNRGGVVRIISARKANRRERAKHDNREIPN